MSGPGRVLTSPSFLIVNGAPTPSVPGARAGRPGRGVECVSSQVYT